jgi:hypothetical protein
MSKAFYVQLKNRGLVHLEGEDRVEFLQGLVTNDVLNLEEQRIQYACLLTPQGKFLHDFFLHWGDGFILIDCEGGFRAQDLYERLNKYRLRSKVKLSFEKEHPVYALIGDETIGLKDPRHFLLGARSFEQPNLPREDFDEWDKQRLILGVPDGSRDMEVERSTLLECNIDKFNAVDWKKGCYMGQELTARMKYRNLGKKHLQVLKFTDMAAPMPFQDIEVDGKIIGNMRSSCGDIGLALIKDEYLEGLKSDTSHSLRLLG